MAITVAGTRPVDPVVSDVIASSVPGEEIFIADKVLPRIDVAGRDFDGQLWVENENPFVGQDHIDIRRSGLQQYHELSSESPTTVNYLCEEHAAKRTVPHDLIRRSQYPMDIRDREAMLVRRGLLHEFELDAATLLFTGGNYAPGQFGALVGLVGGSGVQFGTFGATEFFDLMLAWKLCADSANGMPPNAMILGREAFIGLKTASDIRNFVGNDTERLVLSDAHMLQVLSNAFGIPVENVHVGNARRRTNNPGQAHALADVWVDNVLFYYDGSDSFGAMPVSGGARVAAMTAACVKEELDEGRDIVGFQWESDDPPALVVAGAHSYDNVMVDNTMAFLVTDCVA